MFPLHQILIAEKWIWDEITAWARFKQMPLRQIETLDGIPTYGFNTNGWHR